MIFCLILGRRNTIPEELVCSHLKETVALKVIKITCKEVIDANGEIVVTPLVRCVNL